MLDAGRFSWHPAAIAFKKIKFRIAIAVAPFLQFQLPITFFTLSTIFAAVNPSFS